MLAKGGSLADIVLRPNCRSCREKNMYSAREAISATQENANVTCVTHLTIGDATVGLSSSVMQWPRCHYITLLLMLFSEFLF